MVISTAKFPPLRIAVCARQTKKCLAKEQPFCRLLAGRDLGGTACAKPPELDAEHCYFACPAKSKNNLRLALGELEALACALLSVLLALLHARIAGEKSILAQRGAQFGVEHRNGAGQAHAYGSGLSTDAAAFGGDHHVHLIMQIGELERLGGVVLPRKIREILFGGAAVYGEFAGAGAQKHACNRLFAAAGSENPRLLAHEGRTC